MVNTRQALLLALAIVLITVAAGTITYFSSSNNGKLPKGVEKPKVGTEMNYRFYDSLTGETNSIYADVIVDSEVGAGAGHLRLDTHLASNNPEISDTVYTTIYNFDEGEFGTEYNIVSDSHRFECVKTPMTSAAEKTYLSNNPNTRIKYAGGEAGSSYWYVWDGDTDWSEGSAVSMQMYQTESSTGIMQRMRVDVCTGTADCGQANMDWLYCQYYCHDPTHIWYDRDECTKGGPDNGPMVLSDSCSCSAWPPADEVDFCGISLHWLDVASYDGNSFDKTQTSLFNTPKDADTGADLCVAAGEEFPPSNGTGTGFYEVFPKPTVFHPEDYTKQFSEERYLTPPATDGALKQFEEESLLTDALCWTLFIWDTDWRNACLALAATGGKYGRWCGKGAGNNPHQCDASQVGGDNGVCNDGGLDACCRDHDNAVGGTFSHSEDIAGVMTLLSCRVDAQFKTCRNGASTCANAVGDNIDMGNHAYGTSEAADGRCPMGRNGANKLFGILPCLQYNRYRRSRQNCWWHTGWFHLHRHCTTEYYYEYKYDRVWAWGNYPANDRNF